jgi:hypothetical protein
VPTGIRPPSKVSVFEWLRGDGGVDALDRDEWYYSVRVVDAERRGWPIHVRGWLIQMVDPPVLSGSRFSAGLLIFRTW